MIIQLLKQPKLIGMIMMSSYKKKNQKQSNKESNNQAKKNLLEFFQKHGHLYNLSPYKEIKKKKKSD